MQRSANKAAREAEKARLEAALDEGLEETFPASDPVSAGDLFAGKVEDMTIQVTNRRPEHVQDVQWGHES